MFAVWQQVGNKLFIRSSIHCLRLSCLLDRRPPLTWRWADTCCACKRFKHIAWYQRQNLKPKLCRMSLKSEMWAEHRWKRTSEAGWCIWVRILPTASSPRPRAAVRPTPGFQACVGLPKGRYRSVPDPLPKRFTQWSISQSHTAPYKTHTLIWYKLYFLKHTCQYLPSKLNKSKGCRSRLQALLIHSLTKQYFYCFICSDITDEWVCFLHEANKPSTKRSQ